MTTRRTTKKKVSAIKPSIEGEGNRTADRNYRKGIRKFLKKANPTALARKAAKELDEDAAKDGRDKQATIRGYLETAYQRVRNGIGTMLETVKRWREPRRRQAAR